MSQQFASDNNAGLCPPALAALVAANAAGHAGAYGDDAWTERAVEHIRDLLDAPRAAVFFVFNGTAANALALAQVCRSYHAVIAHSDSHIATDEAGAPGLFTGGGSILTATAPLGKLTPAIVDDLASRGRGVHHVKPRALSITQATELGTVYRPGEIAALGEMASRHGLIVHMDGARFANAVAHIGCAPADLSWRAGVDVLSLGGVKNGLAVGEALVFFDADRAAELEWRIKQAGHLNSKMRLVSAPWAALIETGAWLENARHANAMAQRLAGHLAKLETLRIAFPVEANAVFIEMPLHVQQAVRAKGWRFYTFQGETCCRLMCAWDTTADTVDRFAEDVRQIATAAAGAG